MQHPGSETADARGAGQDTASRDPGARTRLLAGLRIVDLTGPDAQAAGRLAAELGAEVLRIEPPDGDRGRHAGPWAHGKPDVEASLSFAALNSGKLSVVLDPGLPDSMSLLRRIIQTADAVILSGQSQWGEVADPEAIAADGCPVIVQDPFMPGGPYQGFLGPDLVTTALGGLLYISGDAAKPPCAPPEPIGQYFASIWSALALVSAIWAVRKHGRAAVYRISVQEALATQEHLIRAAAMDGKPVVRNGSQHKNVAPANIFPSSDGFVYIYVSRNHWPAFLGVWQPHPAEYDDPKWVPNATRRADAGRLNEAVAAWSRGYSSTELVRLLQGARVPCLPVNRPSDLVKDEQIVAGQFFAPISHPRLGTFLQASFPALIDGARPEPTSPPLLGEHTAQVLDGLEAGETVR